MLMNVQEMKYKEKITPVMISSIVWHPGRVLNEVGLNKDLKD